MTRAIIYFEFKDQWKNADFEFDATNDVRTTSKPVFNYRNRDDNVLLALRNKFGSLIDFKEMSGLSLLEEPNPDFLKTFKNQKFVAKSAKPLGQL
jgi:hypothetical protein